MFGVFSPYELQVIYDWTRGDASDARTGAEAKTTLTFKARQKLHEALELRQGSGADIAPATLLPQATPLENEDHANDFNAEARRLDAALNKTVNRDEAMNLLCTLISPAHHHTAVGLKATRLFSRMFA